MISHIKKKIDKMKHIQKFNENSYRNQQIRNKQNTEISDQEIIDMELHKHTENENNDLNKLIREILDDCKLDVDAIEESDPEFIGYISDKILKWHKNNK